jgi:hypothetical protein
MENLITPEDERSAVASDLLVLTGFDFQLPSYFKDPIEILKKNFLQLS